jgi:hypothetical protein
MDNIDIVLNFETPTIETTVEPPAQTQPIEISENVITNVGSGDNIYAGNNQIKSLKAGSNITLISTEEEIEIKQTSSLKFELFDLEDTDITNKYIEVAGTITDNQSIRVFIENAGIKGEQGIDYSVSGNHIFWQNYDFDGLLETRDTLKIYYIGNN